MQIDLFNPANFIKAGILENMITYVPTSNDIGVGVFKQCADQENKFSMDDAATTQSPSPMIKGKNVNLDLEGIVSSPMDVSKMHLHVNWNGTPLYDQDLKVGQHYDSTLSYQMAWFVPSYAPAGKYDLTLVGYDLDGKTTDLCIAVNFQL